MLVNIMFNIIYKSLVMLIKKLINWS